MGTKEEREGVRGAIRDLLQKERSSGSLREISHYKGLFPGYWDLVAEEYDALEPPSRDGMTISSGGLPTRIPEPPPPSSPPVPAAAPEERIGPYHVVREIGRGGMGVVFEAQDTRLPRRVALKVLSPQFASSTHLRLRFQREAELASRLDHSHICTVYEAGEDDGTPYLAMRFVEGRPLSDLVAATKEGGRTSGAVHLPTREESLAAAADAAAGKTKSVAGRLDLDRVLVLFEKAARALHAAHEKGLIHRDIKPHNIMVTAEGEPVLLDFGLAREEEGEGHQLTQTGSLLGTPAYMSPEQLMAQRVKLDRRTDVYSLGVSLYECLTLKLPFEAPTVDRLYQKILTTDPEDARRLNPLLPADLKVVLDTAMEKDRDRRYQTALDLAEEIRRVREFEPVHARPPEVWYRVARFTRRNQTAVVTSVLAALCAGVLAWAFLAGNMGAGPADLLALGTSMEESGQEVAARMLYEDALRRIDAGAVAEGTVAAQLRERAFAALLAESRGDLDGGRFAEAESKANRALSLAWAMAGADWGSAPVREAGLAAATCRRLDLARKRDEAGLWSVINSKGTFEGSLDIPDSIAGMLANERHPLHEDAVFLLTQCLGTERTGDPAIWVSRGRATPVTLVPELLRFVPRLPARRARASGRLAALSDLVALRAPRAQAVALAAALETSALQEDLRPLAATLLSRSADLPPTAGGADSVARTLERWSEVRDLDRAERWRRRVGWSVRDADAGVGGAEAWLRARTGFREARPAQGWTAWWAERREGDPAKILGEILGSGPEVRAGGIAGHYAAFLAARPELRPGYHTLLGLSVPPDRETPLWYPDVQEAAAPPGLWSAWTTALADLLPQAPTRVVAACLSRGEWQAEPETAWREVRDVRPGGTLVLEKEIAPTDFPRASGWPVRIVLGMSCLDEFASRRYERSEHDDAPTKVRLELEVVRTPDGHRLRGRCFWTPRRWNDSSGDSESGSGFLTWPRASSGVRWPDSHFQEWAVVARIEEGVGEGGGSGTAAEWKPALVRGLAEAASVLAPGAATGPAGAGGSSTGLEAVEDLLRVSCLLPTGDALPALSGLDACLARSDADVEPRISDLRAWSAVARLFAGDPEIPAKLPPIHRGNYRDLHEPLLRLSAEAKDERVRTKAWKCIEEGGARLWGCADGSIAKVERAAQEGRMERGEAYRKHLRARDNSSGFSRLRVPEAPFLVVLALLVAGTSILLLWPTGGTARRLRPAAVAMGLSVVLPLFWVELPESSLPTFAVGAALGITGSFVLALAGWGWFRFVPMALCTVWGTCGLLLSGSDVWMTRSGIVFEVALPGFMLGLPLYVVLLPFAVASLPKARRRGKPEPPPGPDAGWWRRRGGTLPKAQFLLMIVSWGVSGVLTSVVSLALALVPCLAWLAWVLSVVWKEGTIRLREEGSSGRFRA